MEIALIFHSFPRGVCALANRMFARQRAGNQISCQVLNYYPRVPLVSGTSPADQSATGQIMIWFVARHVRYITAAELLRQRGLLHLRVPLVLFKADIIELNLRSEKK